MKLSKRAAEASARETANKRREFLKMFAGVGALGTMGTYAYAGSEKLTAPLAPVPAPQEGAGAKDAEVVVWEMRQSQRPPISIDVHAHWNPPSFVNAQKLVGYGQGTNHTLAEELADNIKFMDERSVQAVIFTVSGRKPWSWLSPDESAREAALVNDAGFEANELYPKRIFLGAEIPAMDPDLSLKEVNRVAGHPAVKGLGLPTDMVNHDYVFDPAFEPVLARCEELNYPLLFHALDGEVHEYGGTQSRIGEPLTSDTFIYNTLGFPWNVDTIAALFIVTGVLDRHPNLKVVLPYAGGSFPYVAGRIQHGLERKKFPLKRPFRDYCKQFYYDTMTYYPEILTFLIDFAGVDHIMVGTDSSYNRSALDHSGTQGRQGRYEWPNALVEYLKLPKDQEEAILRGNAAKMFKMG